MTRQAPAATMTAAIPRPGVSTALARVVVRVAAEPADRSPRSPRAMPRKSRAAIGRTRGPAQEAARFVWVPVKWRPRISTG